MKMMTSMAGFFLTLVLLNFGLSNAVDLKGCHLGSIFNFGDSLSDTGNAEIKFPNPRGFCDGLLIIDRIAEGAGLPYTNPYLNKTLDHSKGVNFAVGGTGILSKKLRRKWNINLPYSNSSLDVQLRWFDQFLRRTFKGNSALRRETLKSSLFVIGGGGNDYDRLPNATGIPSLVKQKERIMTEMMRTFRAAIKKFVRYGARKVIVTGLYQGGCIPNSANKGPDNTVVCDKAVNHFHWIHNQLLQKEIQQLDAMFPKAKIVYGDIWSPIQWIFDHYTSLGFVHPQKACCGNGNITCGFPGAPYCKTPGEYVWWDDKGHLTHAAYKDIYDRMIPRLAAELNCGAH